MTIGFQAHKEVALKLGLRIDPSEGAFTLAKHTIDGVLDGVRLQVYQWQGQYVHVEFTAWLNPPADMRLVIEPAGIGSKLGHFLGKHDIEIGEPTFDAAFTIKADEPERAKKLFTPELQEVLLGWKRAGANLRITDETVHYWLIPGAWKSLTKDELENDIRVLVVLARALNAALTGVPSSQIHAPHVDAWRSYAAARSLDFSSSPLRVMGKLEGSLVSARAVAVDDQKYGVDLQLHFDEPLPFTLRVRPKRFFDFLEATGEASNIAIDPAFDDEFRTITTDDVKARAFLDPAIRSALHDLHVADGDVTLDARGISVRTKTMTDPASFGGIVDRVAAVARKIHDQAGPYR